jgi:hypothetical protein
MVPMHVIILAFAVGFILVFSDPGSAGEVQSAPRAIAVFPVELFDTSGEGEKPGQAERLVLATRTLTDLLAQTGHYKAVDLAPYAPRIAATEPRYTCNGCWREIAKETGAELAAIAVVHKISTLKSTASIYIADLAADRYIAAAHGSFRGDDDKAYVRALTFLVNERLETKTP